MSHFAHLNSGIDQNRANVYAWQQELVSIANHYRGEEFNFRRAIRNLFSAPEILDFSITFTKWQNVFQLVIEELDMAYDQYMRVLEAQAKQDQRLKKIAMGAGFAVLGIALSAVGVGFLGPVIQNALLSEGANLAVKVGVTTVQRVMEFSWQTATQLIVEKTHTAVTNHSNARSIQGQEEQQRTRNDFKQEIHRLRSRLSGVITDMQHVYQDIIKQTTTQIADSDPLSKRLYLEIMVPIGKQKVAVHRINHDRNILKHHSIRHQLPGSIPMIVVEEVEFEDPRMEIDVASIDINNLVARMDGPLLHTFSDDIGDEDLEITHAEFQQALFNWEKNARDGVKRELSGLFDCPMGNPDTKRQEARTTLSKTLWAEWILNHAEKRTGLTRANLQGARQQNSFKYQFNNGKVKAVLSDIGSKITDEWRRLGFFEFRSELYRGSSWEQRQIQQETLANQQVAPHEKKSYASKSIRDRVSGDRAKHGLVEWAQDFLATNPLGRTIGVNQNALQNPNALAQLW